MDEELKRIFFERQKVDQITALIRFPESLDVHVKCTRLGGANAVSNAMVHSASEITVFYEFGMEDGVNSSADIVTLNRVIEDTSTPCIPDTLDTPHGIIRATHDGVNCLSGLSIKRGGANDRRISHPYSKIVAIHNVGERLFVFYLSKGSMVRMLECYITERNRLLPVDNHLFNRIVMGNSDIRRTTIKVSTAGSNEDHLIAHHWRAREENEHDGYVEYHGYLSIMPLLPDAPGRVRVENAYCWCESGGGSGIYFITGNKLLFITFGEEESVEILDFGESVIQEFENNRITMCSISWDGHTDEIVISCCGSWILRVSPSDHTFLAPVLLLEANHGDLHFVSYDRRSKTSALCVVDIDTDTLDIAFVFQDRSKFLAMLQLYPMIPVGEQ